MVWIPPGVEVKTPETWPLAKGVVKTELYNLATDPNEKTDVAEKHPDVLARLESLMKEQHTPNPDIGLFFAKRIGA